MGIYYGAERRYLDEQVHWTKTIGADSSHRLCTLRRTAGGAAGAGEPSLEEVADALVALESSTSSRSFVTCRAYNDSSSSEDDE